MTGVPGHGPVGREATEASPASGVSLVLYLHGFRSSPQSFKARMIAERMAALGLADRFDCPQLPESPAAAVALLVERYAPFGSTALIGSSLGGFYATHLAERFGCRAVLLNPAVDPAARLADQVGTQAPWHGGEPFEFRARYLDELRALRPGRITRPERYFLVAATGDELLDWREMVAAYPGARQRVIDGSDHGLSDFSTYLDDVLAFCGVDASGRAMPARP